VRADTLMFLLVVGVPAAAICWTFYAVTQLEQESGAPPRGTPLRRRTAARLALLGSTGLGVFMLAVVAEVFVYGYSPSLKTLMYGIACSAVLWMLGLDPP
jgi:hypothetical protein